MAFPLKVVAATPVSAFAAHLKTIDYGKNSESSSSIMLYIAKFM
jgi:hypothetical protein